MKEYLWYAILALAAYYVYKTLSASTAHQQAGAGAPYKPYQYRL